MARVTLTPEPAPASAAGANAARARFGIDLATLLGLVGAFGVVAVAMAGGEPMPLAGLWEGWRGPDGEIVRSFTILTTDAAPALRFLHERMPVILEPDGWPLWLGEAAGAPQSLMRTSAAPLRIWPVSTRVNNVRNDGPELLEPPPAALV